MGRGKVRTLISLTVILSFLTIISYAGIFIFGESSLKIPSGTRAEVRPELITFYLEEGKLEVIPESENLKIRTIDKTGKLVYRGTQARFFTECQPEKFKKLTVTDADYRFVKFSGGKPEPDPAGKTVAVPKGTKIEKIEENLYRFHLPSGEIVSFKCNLTSEGYIGDCTRYTKDWKIMYTRTKVKFCRMMTLEEIKALSTSLSEDLWVQFIPESK